MKITPFAPGDTKSFVPLLCPRSLCEGVTRMSELLAVMDEKALAHPGARMLATLDDIGQASYTSGHTIDANELDPLLEYDTVEEEADDVEPPLPDLTLRLSRMVEVAASVTLDQIRNRLGWSGEGRPHFLLLHDRPDSILDTKQIYIEALPVAHAWQTIAAFPNGYFHGDLSPMENLVLARHLEQEFGHALFGIGASYLGFRRGSPLSSERLDALAAFITDPHAESSEPDLTAKIGITLAATDLLFLRYVGS